MLLNFVHLYKLGENIFADLGFTLILLELYTPESNKEYNFFFFLNNKPDLIRTYQGPTSFLWVLKAAGYIKIHIN